MRQVLQNLKDGTVEIAELPVPAVGAGKILIRTTRSLISSGTERMLLEFGKAGWLEKARQQPEKVKQVLDKIRTDGLFQTVQAVRSKLDTPIPLGYCNVGVVAGLGSGVKGFSLGDRVASNGPHAELAVVPSNLCALIPQGVSDDAAAFTVMGAIALQGIRLAKPSLGESFVVFGLGLIGLLTVQLLRAHGCRVMGIEPDATRACLAKNLGAEVVVSGQEDPLRAALSFCGEHGVDGVILTLSARSHGPLSQAARMCRKRGRIVLVGVTGLNLNRSDFYEKELSFQVSCSYGPGRYDPDYEQKGQDYPIGFVRWTAKRNLEAVLQSMASGALNVEPLITHRFSFEEAPRAYELLTTGKEPHLGILLEYRQEALLHERTLELSQEPVKFTASPGVRLGVVGAGNYAGGVLIPAFGKTGALLHTLANQGGISGIHYGRRHSFRRITTKAEAVLTHPEINAVLIATRHDSHAALVCEALRAGKHVFCEKPLAMGLSELEEIQKAWEEAAKRDPLILMVGFNRRFSPLVKKLRELLQDVLEPKVFIATINAGAVPRDHWIQDPQVGGGRILGEACHFVDLLRHLAGSPIGDWSIHRAGRGKSQEFGDDMAVINLAFEDGSLGTIHYLSNGHRSFPKERIEVFAEGRVLQIDNFRVLRGFGWRGFGGMRLWRQDKGNEACVKAFVDAVVRGGPAPIPFGEIFQVSKATIELAQKV